MKGLYLVSEHRVKTPADFQRAAAVRRMEDICSQAEILKNRPPLKEMLCLFAACHQEA
jgi:hypothetical protein